MQAPIQHHDSQDDAILDECFGSLVTFECPCVAGFASRKNMQGVIIDVRTPKSGAREVRINTPELNLPKWVSVDAIVAYHWPTVEAAEVTETAEAAA